MIYLLIYLLIYGRLAFPTSQSAAMATDPISKAAIKHSNDFIILSPIAKR